MVSINRRLASIAPDDRLCRINGESLTIIASVEQPEAEDAVEGDDAVPPSDLLPLGVRPAMVRDRHLVDPAAELGHLDRQLGLDPEPIRLKAETLEHVGPEDFVPDLDIAQVEVRGHVAEVGEEPIPDVVPEVEDAVRPTMESVAEDNVGVAFQDWLEEPRVVLRVVLQVGVLDEDDVAGHVLDGGADRCSLAAIARVEEEVHLPPVVATQSFQDLTRSVTRGVIHEDDLLVIRDRLNPLEEQFDRLPLIIDRNDDGELHRASWVGRSVGPLEGGSVRRPPAGPTS